MISYPSVEDIVLANVKVLREIKVKKADKHEVLSREKIRKLLGRVEEVKGDVYDKATILLRELVQAHPFASGNRRTAFLVTQNFLIYNEKELRMNNDQNAYILQGIREGYYSDEEIKNWLIKGEIREFKRK